MAKLVLLILIVAVGWMVWRNFTRSVATRRPPVVPQRPEATSLELDPKTGVYRPPNRRGPG